MHRVKDKVEDAAAVAKEKAEIFKAKVEEKAEKAVARTEEEKTIAKERREAMEYEAKMKLHQTKAEILEDKLSRRHHHHGHRDDHVIGTQGQHEPVGTASAADLTTGVPTPSYPLGAHPPGHEKYR